MTNATQCLTTHTHDVLSGLFGWVVTEVKMDQLHLNCWRQVHSNGLITYAEGTRNDGVPDDVAREWAQNKAHGHTATGQDDVDAMLEQVDCLLRLTARYPNCSAVGLLRI